MPPPSAPEEEHVFPDRHRSHLSGDESSALVESVQTWRYSVDARQYGFFLAKKVRKYGRRVVPEHGTAECEDLPEYRRPETPGSPTSSLDFSWKVDSLSKYDEGFFDSVHRDDRFVGFADPSTYESYPGWMLRNLLVLIRQRWHLQKVQILCYRDIQSRRHEANTTILRLEMEATSKEGQAAASTETSSGTNPTPPKITGWERNAAGKVTSKIANLGEYMDPKRYVSYRCSRKTDFLDWLIKRLI